jgi:hypothetical protein
MSVVHGYWHNACTFVYTEHDTTYQEINSTTGVTCSNTDYL